MDDDDDDDEGEDKERRDSKSSGEKFYLDLQNAKHEHKDNGSGFGGADTRDDKAARGKRLFGSKKK